MRKFVVLSGAGVSAESGIKTFRDSDGLWENYNVRDVADIEGWYRDKKLVLDFYNQRRRQLKTAEPNQAHRIIADLEKYNKQFPDVEIDFIQFSDKNHDRFLIIDDDVYMLGNSVKDFGNAWGVVIKMEMSKGEILAMVERR